MSLDSTTLCHICSFVIPQRAQPLSLSIFGVCREWRTILCGPASASFWQQLFHARFPRFLQPLSPSKKRSVSAVLHDYRKLYLYTSAILQVDSRLYNPSKSNEFEDPFVELPKDTARYSSELMESIALRLFSKKFAQYVVYNRHHLLYGPAGCGKAMLIESLAKIWGSHVITVQYPELVRIASIMDWSGYVDIMCNYIQAFCETNAPTIVHLRHMTQLGMPLTQNALNVLLKNLPIANVWVIGTTNLPNTAIVQHSELLTAKLYIPFPSSTERETYLKAHLLPTTSPSALHQPRITTLNLSHTPSPSPSSSLPSSSSSSLDLSLPLPSDQKIHAVSAPYIHFLALRTPNFTYADLRDLCDRLRNEFARGDQKASLPFVKLMDVLAKVVPFYKPEDAKRYETSEGSATQNVSSERRRLSVPTSI